MKILVFGGKGYMGQEFLRLFPNAVAPPVDIADCNAVAVALDAEKPDFVINAAGKTGRPNVDWCEDHKAETLYANVTGPLVLAQACLENKQMDAGESRGLRLVHLGSGCVYDGYNDG